MILCVIAEINTPDAFLPGEACATSAKEFVAVQEEFFQVNLATATKHGRLV